MTDLSTRIQSTTQRLANARIAVATVERELDDLLAEVATLAPRRPRGRPRKDATAPAPPQRRRSTRNKPKTSPGRHAVNGTAVGQA